MAGVPLNAAAVLVLGSILSIQEFGYYGISVTAFTIVGTVASAGSNTLIPAYFRDRSGDVDLSYLADFKRRQRLFALAVSTITGAAVGLSTGRGLLGFVVVIACIGQAELLVLISIARSLEIEHLTGRVVQVAGPILRLIGLGALVLVEPLQTAEAATAVYVISLVVVAAAIRPLLATEPESTGTTRPSVGLRPIAGFVYADLSAMLLARLDVLLVASQVGVADAGLYFAATRLSGPALAPIAAIGNVMAGRIRRLLDQSPAAFLRLYAKLGLAGFVLSVLAGLAIYTLFELSPIALPSELAGALPPTLVLMAGYAITSLMGPTNWLVTFTVGPVPLGHYQMAGAIAVTIALVGLPVSLSATTAALAVSIVRVGISMVQVAHGTHVVRAAHSDISSAGFSDGTHSEVVAPR